MEKFNKLLKKLAKPEERSDYVRDPYDESAMNEEVSQYSEQLSPEDLKKLMFAESSGGKFTSNPESSASGPYQIIDSTRKEAEKHAIDQGLDVNEPNPLRKDAILMKANVKRMEEKLKNAKNGPFEPNIENIDLLHKSGITGGLRALNNPDLPISKAKFREIQQRLAKLPKKTKESVKPAKNLPELLKD